MTTQPRPGLYKKFEVRRLVGEDKPGEEYFVLSPSHDPLARPAVLAYADACEKNGLQDLAVELRAGVERTERGESFYGDS